MGTRSNEVTITVAYTKTQIIIDIDKLKITAVGLTAKTATANVISSYADISLYNGSQSQEAIGTELTSGYFGSNVPLGWQGKLTGEPSQYIIANIWSSVAASFRLTIITET